VLIPRAIREAGFWLALVLTGALLLGRDGYLKLKGAVAGELVAAAVTAYLCDGAAHRPWRWADFQPRGRLRVPRLAVDRPVLAGAAGQAMAFGLAHVAGSALPGQADNVVLSGHRDSWAAFMAQLRAGDLLVLEYFGGQQAYRVQETAVLPRHATAVLARDGDPCLTLITCYPFGAMLPSSDRFVLRAVPEAADRLALNRPIQGL
jgi:sortase A